MRSPVSETGRRFGAGLFAGSLVVGMCLLAGCGESKPADSRSGEAAATAKHPPAADTAAGWQQSAEPNPDDQFSLPVVLRTPDRLLANFGLLRTPPEGLPQAITRILHKPAWGSNWALAQRVPTRSNRVWVVPATGHICLVKDTGTKTVSSTCATVKQARAQGRMTTSLREKQLGAMETITVGVVPDGHPRVDVYTPGSPAASARVVDNTFTLRSDAASPPERLGFGN